MATVGTKRRGKRAPSPNVDEEVPSAVSDALAALDALSQSLRGMGQVKDILSDLLAENARLREENMRLTGAGAAAPAPGSAAPPPELAREKATLYRGQLQALLQLHAQLEGRAEELSAVNASLTSMSTGFSQLHATLDLRQVLDVLVEVLVTFVGARTWAVLVAEKDHVTLRVAREAGLEGRLASTGIEPTGALAEALASGSPALHPTGLPAPNEPLVTVPLVAGTERVGAVVVYSLVPHKDHLTEHDVEMLSLLGGHAASALAGALLFEQTQEKARTLGSMVQLVET